MGRILTVIPSFSTLMNHLVDDETLGLDHIPDDAIYFFGCPRESVFGPTVEELSHIHYIGRNKLEKLRTTMDALRPRLLAAESDGRLGFRRLLSPGHPVQELTWEPLIDMLRKHGDVRIRRTAKLREALPQNGTNDALFIMQKQAAKQGVVIMLPYDIHRAIHAIGA